MQFFVKVSSIMAWMGAISLIVLLLAGGWTYSQLMLTLNSMDVGTQEVDSAKVGHYIAVLNALSGWVPRLVGIFAAAIGGGVGVPLVNALVERLRVSKPA